MLHLVLILGTSSPRSRAKPAARGALSWWLGSGDRTLHESQQTGDEYTQNGVKEICEEFHGC